MFSAIRNAAISAAALGLCVGVAVPVQAAYVVTLEQVGADVVATGSGSIDLTGLVLFAAGGAFPAVEPSLGDVVTGPATLANTSFYTGFNGPPSFGPGHGGTPDSGTGDMVGIFFADAIVVVPSNYVSDAALSDTSTYDNATIASLGASPGTYVWTWGTGANADSFTLDIVAAAPEPASLSLLALGLAGLGLVLRTRRI